MKATVRVSALIHPTELQERVETSIKNIFPIELHLQDFGIPRLYGEGDLESLRKLHILLREGRILDTMRSVLLREKRGNHTEFCLNKQVAFAGKVNFSTGNESLGPVYAEISTDSEEDLQKIIDWLAPVTVDGKPVEEIEL